MKIENDYKPINLKKTLKLMPLWAKEKDRRYREQKKFREKLFGPLIKQLKLDS